jgi:hypothetical protein
MAGAISLVERYCQGTRLTSTETAYGQTPVNEMEASSEVTKTHMYACTLYGHRQATETSEVDDHM